MLTPFEQYHKQLLAYCTVIVKDKKLACDPSDLLNEAFVIFSEIGKEFRFHDLKNIIIDITRKELDHQIRSNDIDNYKKRQPHIKGEICCIKCHEVKPVNAFPFENNTGIQIVRNICFSCKKLYDKKRSAHKRSISPKKERVLKYKTEEERKAAKREQVKKSIKKNWHKYKTKHYKSTKKYLQKNKEKWAAYMRERRNKLSPPKPKKDARPIRELWREANRRYQEKQRENLTDVYIRGLLKALKKDFSPEAIIEKRSEIQGTGITSYLKKTREEIKETSILYSKKQEKPYEFYIDPFVKEKEIEKPRSQIISRPSAGIRLI